VVRFPVGEVSDERDAERVVVVSADVGSHVVPASTLVHVAVLADQEIVADVPPTCCTQLYTASRSASAAAAIDDGSMADPGISGRWNDPSASPVSATGMDVTAV